MKKSVVCLILLFLYVFIFSFQCFCYDEKIDSLPENIKDDLFSVMGDDVRQALEEMGITDKSFDNLYDISFSGIASYFKTTLAEKAKSCIRNTFSLFGIVFVLGIVATFFKAASQDSLISPLSGSVVSLMSVSLFSNSLSAIVSVLNLSGSFMLSFVPIYTLIISFSGAPASAFSYNSLVLFFAEAVSGLISRGAVDFMGLYFCLSVAFSLNEGVNVNRFISVVNKVISVVLGLCASVFTGFLTIKGVLCAEIDSVSVKSVRFLLSSLIPVVGSSISEAYSSLLGSINLIKGSVALIGILAILVINLPVITETFIYYCAFTALSYISDGFGDERTSDIFKCFSCGIKIILLLCVFEMFVLIVSTGIVLSLKGGGV